MNHFFSYQNTIRIQHHKPSKAIRGNSCKDMDIISNLKTKVLVT